jgi:NADPH:quinone reductase-like Zn-dependent oxidoreductase
MTDVPPTDVPSTGRILRSLVSEDATLRLYLDTVDIPRPAGRQVLVRVEATPINPSDLGLLLGLADVSRAEYGHDERGPTVTAPVPPEGMEAMAARVGRPLAVGNEGAGTVVAAGDDPAAQALLGRTVAVFGGRLYAEYRLSDVAECMPLPEGVTAAQGAACFVNPLTALGMVGTMQREGHRALVHTAAASNLGQMLNRLCLADGIGLVNVVRRQEHVDLLRAAGAEHVCDSSTPSFADDLTAALEATGATIAFDAVGGGPLAGQILGAMEAALVRGGAELGRYGSTTHKQVYIYGSLDRRPTEIQRTFGFAWSVGGWLLMPYLEHVGPDEAQRLRDRVATEITTTFASTYAHSVNLTDALTEVALRGYAQPATGQKYLITPHG